MRTGLGLFNSALSIASSGVSQACTTDAFWATLQVLLHLRLQTILPLLLSVRQ